MTNKLYAGVIIDQAHPALDKIFNYEIPHELIAKIDVGMRVSVPFGKGNRTLDAYVMTLDRKIDLPEDKIKPIHKILNPKPIILSELIPIIWWMKREYHCLTIDAIRCFLPPGLKSNIGGKTKKIVFLNVDSGIEKKISEIESRSSYMAEILRLLDNEDGLDLGELADMAGGAPMSSFKNLERRGWITIEEKEIYRDPWEEGSLETKSSKITLSKEQKEAMATIEKGLKGTGGVFLLHGITGSGKTQVYMDLVEMALTMKKGAIILVPEISLTPQTVSRFKGRFGKEVAIFHSRLSIGERYDEWRRVYYGQVDIVVGARSAIFAPMKNLGLMVIDEAHEDSYKSESKPRYDAIDLGIERCRRQGATLVLGSATPSLRDYHRSQSNIYTPVAMKHRIDYKPLPKVELVDMRVELEKGNRSIFSQRLYDGLRLVTEKKEQAIILINRRGYAQFVSCRSCGYVVKCKNCDISLTYHSKNNLLKCHYCETIKPYPRICPDCKSHYIRHFGVGTQRVEMEIKKLLPQARIIRMDMDTTSRKGAHAKILDAFRAKEYDILLGTQMVAKGLDFPDVTLVGVIAADTSLNLPDYRSSEKTFQLITQVAGRAGRGNRLGRVVVQTYQPDHYAIQYASGHDYLGFFGREIGVRKQFNYPPFSHIIRLLVTGEEEKLVINRAKSLEGELRLKSTEDSIMKSGTFEIGAYPAPLERIKSKYRWHVLIRIRNERIFLERFHDSIDQCLSKYSDTKSNIVVDFYPRSLL